MKYQTLIFVLVLGAAGAALAQAPAAPAVPATPATPAAASNAVNTPRVDQRQANQQRRIDQGVASGQLTPRETFRMERQQQRIANAETRAKADGVVTRQERRHLQHKQNQASRHIYRQKHDRQRVAPAR